MLGEFQKDLENIIKLLSNVEDQIMKNVSKGVFDGKTRIKILF